MRQSVIILWLWGIWLSAAAAAWPHNRLALEKIAAGDHQQQNFSFVVMGDNRDGDEVFKKIIARVDRDAEVVFSLDNGDLVSDGYRYQFESFEKMIDRSRVPIIGIIGNHEIPWYDAEANYRAAMGQSYFSFSYGNSYFIVLDDSNKRELGKAQEQWLHDELEKSRAFKHRFVFMHVPLYDPRKGRYEKGHSLKDIELSRRLNDLFDRYDLDMLFSAHIHAYFRGTWKNTPFIISGGAGAPLENNGFYHYIKVDVTGDDVTYRVVPLE